MSLNSCLNKNNLHGRRLNSVPVLLSAPWSSKGKWRNKKLFFAASVLNETVYANSDPEPSSARRLYLEKPSLRGGTTKQSHLCVSSIEIASADEKSASQRRIF